MSGGASDNRFRPSPFIVTRFFLAGFVFFFGAFLSILVHWQKQAKTVVLLVTVL